MTNQVELAHEHMLAEHIKGGAIDGCMCDCCTACREAAKPIYDMLADCVYSLESAQRDTNWGDGDSTLARAQLLLASR